MFDVHSGSGRDGRFTYPDDVPGAYGGGPAQPLDDADRDGVLVKTFGAPASRRPVRPTSR